MGAFVIKLDGDGKYQQLLSGAPQTCGMRSGRMHLQPGQQCGCHSTNNYEEQLVFLSGAGIAEIDNRPAFAVEAGSIAYIPPQTAHNIRNTGTEPLTYIFCVAPANPSAAAKHCCAP